MPLKTAKGWYSHCPESERYQGNKSVLGYRELCVGHVEPEVL